MKHTYQYIAGCVALLAAAFAGTACQDNFDTETPATPVASERPTMSIYDLKVKYWQEATNYIDTIGLRVDTIKNDKGEIVKLEYPVDGNGNRVSDGRDYVIAGRVISSDEAGNVFKSLVIQDETAALAISINSYNLYLKYRVGQELVIDLRGMYIGKYNGLVQLGMPEWYEAGSAWEATFMAPEYFDQHVQPNGWPDAAKVDTLEINAFNELPSNPEGLCRYQSQIVKFNNVYFQNAGSQQFSEYHSSGVNQNIVDANGQTLPVRTSGYSNFWNNYLPEGNGDVVCILSYYGTTGWQLILNDYAGCMNFGNPTLSPGTEDNPWTIAEAIATVQSGHSKGGWVEGYIVGAVAPEVSEVTSNADIEWGADVVLDNTLVIGATPDTRDVSQAMVVSLPQGSMLRKYGNLVDNPGNYQKHIALKGSFGTYMGTYGILGNTGKKSEFAIEGVTVDDGSAAAGDGTEAKPYNVSQVIAGATGTSAWVTGYIVGWVDGQVLASGAHFDSAASVATNLLIADTPDVKDVAQCIPVQLPVGDVRTALNLQNNPGNYLKRVSLCGSLERYFGTAGLKSVTSYKLDGNSGGGTTDNPSTPGDPKGEGTQTSPYNVAKALEVAKANGESSDVSVYTEGYVISGSIDTSYGNGTWDICDSPDGKGSTIKVFRAKDFDNQKFTDASKVKVGDKIVVYAPLVNYMGNTPETNLGYLYSINGQTGGNGGGGTTTPDNPVTPPGDGDGTETSPLSVAQVNAGATGTSAWVKGYIVGWIEGQVLASGAHFNSESTIKTNLLIADSPDVTDVTKCIPVQLPSGNVRTALNLQDNPGNYLKQVILCGSLEKYFGAAGLKSVSEYKFVD